MTVELTKAFAFSIITMLALVLGEYAVSRWMKKRVFEFSDSLTNLACGILERTIFLLFVVIYYAAFTFFHEHFSIAHIPINPFTTVLLFIAVDFLWYWYHRAGHEINVLWAAHITHHQSEEYNFTLSFRVSAIQLIIRMFFWLWLPIIGFDPALTTLIIGINGAYQFFIHTRLINKLGFLENILVTPSHHRVHHGKNEKYIDKNYGGIFIIWDRIFGTFEREVEEVQYGITKPMKSHNPIVAWFHYFVDLYKASKLEKGLKNKIRIFLAGPETLGKYYDLHKTDVPKDIRANKNLKVYLLTQFTLISAVFAAVYYYTDTMPMSVQYIAITFLVFSTLSLGFVLDRHPISFALEMFRIVGMSAGIFLSLYLTQLTQYYAIAMIPAVVFIPWIVKTKDAFRKELEIEQKVETKANEEIREEEPSLA
ncbi:MAG: sterol desaturase family protein [Flavobacteriales bacterium]